MKNIFEVLTSYYENDNDTKRAAVDMGLDIAEIAEMRAERMKDTPEGQVIYNNIMSTLSEVINE